VLGGVDIVQMFATILLVIVSISLIAVVLLQSGRSAGLSGAISGGAEQLVGKQKARGIDAVLIKATVVLSVLFFVLTVTVAYFL
jgi:preprotein translocase subunit SecG